jgi:hypothetical protein
LTFYHQHVFFINRFQEWLKHEGTNAEWCAQACNTATVGHLTPPAPSSATTNAPPLLGEHETAKLSGNLLLLALGMVLLQEQPISDALLASNEMLLEVDLKGHEDDSDEELHSYLLSQKMGRLKAWLVIRGLTFKLNQDHTSADYAWRVMRVLAIFKERRAQGRPCTIVPTVAAHHSLAGLHLCTMTPQRKSP